MAPRPGRSLTHINGRPLLMAPWSMTPSNEPRPGKDAPKPSHLDEARRIIEEYEKDLREIIKKLYQKMN
ncbi:hypothetical protein GCM10007857_26240 [Bradyrhizobium iriomotense]|uniref:Uncharacterized protein n=1 Tax=Bradyrhizobium iriomotense TaxID=441950 RepID=A0ABQ6B164_9BRAD|nr:hypothetical protein GCM10007857_26240 [Bradyrhizobium iriomotense]